MTRWQQTLFILVAAQLVSAVGFGMFFPFLPLYVEHLGTNTGFSLEFWAGMVFWGRRSPWRSVHRSGVRWRIASGAKR
jgi:DHA1 family multidrug resistance protein-like MFS transporter